jgi:hypothetical protein
MRGMICAKPTKNNDDLSNNNKNMELWGVEPQAS